MLKTNLMNAAKSAGINGLELAHFMAQIEHESNGFQLTEESLNYTAVRLIAVWPTRFTPALATELEHKPREIAEHVYGGRLGNTEPGDGWRYRGRGLIQLTGRHNYRAFGKAAKLDTENKPELLLNEAVAIEAAIWFWNTSRAPQCALADDVEGVTLAINGGLNGFKHRKALTEQWKAKLLPNGQAPWLLVVLDEHNNEVAAHEWPGGADVVARVSAARGRIYIRPEIVKGGD